MITMMMTNHQFSNVHIYRSYYDAPIQLQSVVVTALSCNATFFREIMTSADTTDLYKVPDAVPPIHAVSSHVATDKGPSKFRSIFSGDLQPIATRGKKARCRYWLFQ